MADTGTYYRYPQALVTTDWLAEHLNDPKLRIFDCTTYLLPKDPDSDLPYRTDNGRADYDKGHIPGAAFVDLQADLSDNGTRLRFTLPSAEAFATAMSRLGVGDGMHVVLYSADTLQWATRLWWMLRAFGFDQVSILDGGWEKWQAEGKPVEMEESRYPAAEFIARPRSGLFVDKHTVVNALDQDNTVIINALKPEFHQGLTPSRYGRPGRIPGSVNVPAGSLLDAESHTVVAALQAQETFTAAGVDTEKQVIAYCGGGIAATLDLFLLHQLGYENLALYDASMGEWAGDESLPIETD